MSPGVGPPTIPANCSGVMPNAASVATSVASVRTVGTITPSHSTAPLAGSWVPGAKGEYMQ